MEQLKVMIVDDDMLSVDYIKNLIQWETYGFEVSQTAYNGKQALKLFDKCPVQLLITDISMPLMDGIELIREVKKQYPETRTILLTAYSEFEYARAAVTAGVDYYIIKDEMTKEVLAQKLASIKKTIGNIKHISGILFQKALIDFFTEGEDFVAERYQNQEILSFFSQSYPCILLEQNEAWRSWDEGENHLDTSMAEILKIILEEIGNDNLMQYGILPFHQILLFFRPDGSGYDYKQYQRIIQMSSRLVDLLREDKKVFTAYYMYLPVSVTYINKFIKNRLDSYAFLHGCKKAYCMEECTVTESREGKSVREEQVKKYLDEQDEKGFYLYVEECLAVQSVGISIIYKNLQEFMRILDKILQSDGLEQADVFETKSLYDIKEIRKWIQDGFSRLLRRRGSMGFRWEVSEVMRYVRKHYQREDLAISELAGHVGISNSRLSVLFKQDTGITINQFITGIRIERAKELLLQGNYKVYEVAEQVGYVTSQYLSKIFYRETGCYPAEYKRKG